MVAWSNGQIVRALTIKPFQFPNRVYSSIVALYDKTMDQNRPLLITTEEIAKFPILIVDKKGFIGNALAKILRDQFLVVIVTGADVQRHDNVIHIPYRKRIPLIPDNAYSHIFVIYNEETEILDMLSSFEQKAEAVKARIVFVTSIIHGNAKLFKRILISQYRLLQVVLYGETFENNIVEANEINFFIHQARTYGRIEVPGDGLGTLYPIYFDDILSALVSIAFTLEKPTKPIFLFPHHAYNEITIARIIQTADPTVKIDFAKRKSTARKYYLPEGLYFFRSYKLDEALHKIDYSRVGRRTKLPQKKIKLKVPDSQIHKTRMRLFWATIIAVFVAPLILTFLFAVGGAGLLTLSVRQLEGGALQSAQNTANFAQDAFSTAQTLGPSLLLPQILIPQQKAQFLELMQTGQTVALTEISFAQAIQTLQTIYEKKSLDPKNDFLESIVTIKNALLTMQQLEAEKKLPTSVLVHLRNLDGTINLAEETIDTWPSLFGFTGKKTYLVLFQNNMELRPGGGFIGSYGTLTVNNGIFGKMQVHDVYDADGQLSEAIQPPYGLQRYLGATHWFLRDSNFDPDFSVDAKQAAQFLQKETGQKVDGVIAIDTTFIKNLIGVVGSVDVVDYKVTVTPDNFYLLTETNAEKNFFPGSTQKKDFLRSLTNALMDKLSSEKKIPYEKLAQLFVSSVAQKDLLVSFSDPGVQNVFTVNDLSSSLWDGRHAENNVADDFLGVIDANVGANKANYYINRSITQSTSLSDLAALQTTVEITYKNTSQPTSAFGGDYKDYLRLILPANTTLVSIAFDKKPTQITPAITDPALFTAPDFTPPPGLEVEQDEEEGKSIVGFFFIVPAGSTRVVSVSYRSLSGIDPNAVAFGYNLRLFKEPGTVNDPYQVSLAFPDQITLVGSDKDFTDVGGKLIYDGYLSQDKDLTARFAKK